MIPVYDREPTTAEKIEAMRFVINRLEAEINALERERQLETAFDEMISVARTEGLYMPDITNAAPQGEDCP